LAAIRGALSKDLFPAEGHLKNGLAQWTGVEHPCTSNGKADRSHVSYYAQAKMGDPRSGGPDFAIMCDCTALRRNARLTDGARLRDDLPDHAPADVRKPLVAPRVQVGQAVLV
jgi:hypothetical protein